MSVHSVKYPGSPISIPDELESFFHVLLYLAVRYLRSSLPCPGLFIDEYFMSSGNDARGQILCSNLKRDVINNGELVYDDEPLTFLPDPRRQSSPGSRDVAPSSAEDDRPSASPLDHLIADLLRHFKAHYAVMKYNAALKARELPPKPLKSLYDTTAKTSTTPAAPVVSHDVGLLLGMRQDFGDGQTPAMPAPRAIEPPPAETTVVELREPSVEEKALAAMLTMHERVKDLFFSHLRPPAVWPAQDRVGDQLKGYARAETASKRPRRESAMVSIMEGVEASPQVSSGI